MSTPANQIVAVLGAGSWGTALAYLVSVKGAATRLWTRNEEVARNLAHSHQNIKYLPGASLERVAVSADLFDVIAGATWIIVAVPCAGVPALAAHLSGK